MNSEKVRNIIAGYKANFQYIHCEEIYKWRAVKHFQDNWDIDASDFFLMFNKAFRLVSNLLDVGNYFPKRMLLLYAEREPENVRELFKALYDESNDLIFRIENFKNGIEKINQRHFPLRKSFQDHRALLVYLCLQYPDRYYFYKFEMVKVFVSQIDYPYRPIAGRIQNVLEYLSLCDLIREEIRKDGDLLNMHSTRIKEYEYADAEYHILTQDVIYAATEHLNLLSDYTEQQPASTRLTQVDVPALSETRKIELKGSFINHLENEAEQKLIGDLGELLVLQYEQEKLKKLHTNKVPVHIAKEKGDGLGYDILSWNERDDIFIEVKTTTGGIETPFFLTENELECSKRYADKYFLYRLYEYDKQNNSAKFFVLKGSLLNLNPQPIKHKVSFRVE